MHRVETGVREGKVIVVPVLMTATAAAVLWSVVKYQSTYIALIDSLPPQFQDGLMSKFAFPEYVLRASTPLPLQADYVESLTAACFAALGISLLCFLYGKAIVGSIVAVMFLGFTAIAIKSWKTYQANCNRPTAHADEEATLKE